MKPLLVTPWSRCQSRSRRILAREAVRILQSRWRRELGRAVDNGARTHLHLHTCMQTHNLSRSLAHQGEHALAAHARAARATANVSSLALHLHLFALQVGNLGLDVGMRDGELRRGRAGVGPQRGRVLLLLHRR
jgi:hypothetical protein